MSPYPPPRFACDDVATLHAMIRQQPFALLHVIDTERLLTTALPLLLDTDGTRLLGHMARANPQWAVIAASGPATAQFLGPHAYVSPTWTPATMVPTWNYTLVEARGPVQVFHDAERLHDTVQALSAVHEAGKQPPWDGDYPDTLLTQIVGIELQIEQLRGIRKLSQNKPAAVRADLAAGLHQQGGMAAAVGALMQEDAELSGRGAAPGRRAPRA